MNSPQEQAGTDCGVREVSTNAMPQLRADAVHAANAASAAETANGAMGLVRMVLLNLTGAYYTIILTFKGL